VIDQFPRLRFRIPFLFIDASAGLPSGQVQDILQDCDGIIWSVGPSGISSFNGTRIKNYGPKDGLSTHGLRAVHLDSSQRLMIGSDVGVEILKHTHLMSVSPLLDDWQYGVVDKIQSDMHDNVWVSTTTGMLKFTDHQVQVHHLPIAGLPQFLTNTKNGMFWAGGISIGLYYFENNAWHKPECSGLDRVSHPYYCFPDSEDGFFIIGEGEIAHYDGDGKFASLVEHEAIKGVTAGLCIHKELWIAGNNNLYRFVLVNGAWVYVDCVYRGLFIKKLFADTIGNIWGATDNKGYFKISALRQIIHHIEYKSGGSVFSIRQNKSKQILVGGDQHSYILDIGQNEITEISSQIANKAVWDLFETSTNHKWAATDQGVYNIFSESTSVKLRSSELMRSQARVLLQDNNSLYIGTIFGLYKFKDNLLTEIKDKSGRSLGYVYHLTKHVSADRIWIATLGNGLLYLQGDDIVEVNNDILNPQGNTYSLAISDEDNIVILQDNNIIQCDVDGKYSLLASTEHNIAGWCCVYGQSNTIWIGTSSGLLEFNLDTKTFGRKINSLLNITEWEFTTARSLYRDVEKNLLYCGLNSGLTIIDLNKLEEFTMTPEIRVDDIIWEDTNYQLFGDVYTLTEGKWSVNIKISTHHFVDIKNILIRYKLIGFHSSWSTAKHIDKIRFTSLPAGDYVLEAQAFYPMTGYGPIKQIVSLSVQSKSIITKSIAALFRPFEDVLSYYKIKKKNQDLSNQNLELLEEVSKRTQELERAMANLKNVNQELKTSSTTDPLTGIANRRQLETVLKHEIERSLRIKSPLTMMMIDVDFFKKYNDYFGHIQGDLCLKQIAESLTKSCRKGTDVVARYGGEEFTLIMSNTNLQQGLALSVKLCQIIESLQLTHPASEVSKVVTISMGITCFKANQTVNIPEVKLISKSMFLCADKGLYDAKKSGRNQAKPFELEIGRLNQEL
jgi:diguanylate cyclase (GGDEF)-like protein